MIGEECFAFPSRLFVRAYRTGIGTFEITNCDLKRPGRPPVLTESVHRAGRLEWHVAHSFAQYGVSGIASTAINQ